MIVAVIVTFNRVNLLKRALTHIENQEVKPDRIVLVDNHSDDGTQDFCKEYLSLQDLNNESFESQYVSYQMDGNLNDIGCNYLRTSRNGGGALGFYLGSKYAVDVLEAEAVWLMDDDGYPQNQCLKELLNVDESFSASLVVDESNNENLSFGFGALHRVKDFSGLEVVKGYANPYNSILLRREAFIDAGFPREDFFIYGDENEFQQRLKRCGHVPTLAVNSIHYHPRNRQEEEIVLGFIKINKIQGGLRSYCYYRNTFYVLRVYLGVFAAVRWAAKSIFANLVKGRVGVVWVMCKAFQESFKKHFKGHYKYLLK
ncbi:Galactofuranosyltransferase GlfT1 [Thalassocella blandensis]|nr:Galactofuranosyltransferase GlfT1 [Thalassocella blandensis]